MLGKKPWHSFIHPKGVQRHLGHGTLGYSTLVLENHVFRGSSERNLNRWNKVWPLLDWNETCTITSPLGIWLDTPVVVHTYMCYSAYHRDHHFHPLHPHSRPLHHTATAWLYTYSWNRQIGSRDRRNLSMKKVQKQWIKDERDIWNS